MNPTLRNILAVLAGLAAGMIINSLLVNIGPSIIPLPEGADVSDMEKLKASMALFEPKHFIFPFLGHAMQALVGAFIAVKIAVSNHFRIAMIIGVISLIGGITAAAMFGGPAWFVILDLAVAYLPMAWLGWKLAGGKTTRAIKEQAD
ncbi:MAG: hypothetical protein R3B47_08660 [Bacteroidia bacterium]